MKDYKKHLLLIIITMIILSSCGRSQMKVPDTRKIDTRKIENVQVSAPQEEKENHDYENDSSLYKILSPNKGFNDPKYIPSKLVEIKNGKIINDKKQLLRKDAADNMIALGDAFYNVFKKKLVIVSGYRSYEYQLGIEKNNKSCIDSGYCAKAGFSEHQTGNAVDLIEATTKEIFLSKESNVKYFKWLNENAYKFGFVNSYNKGIEIDGYHEEPWHWRYVGKEMAAILKEKDMSLGEFGKSYR